MRLLCAMLLTVTALAAPQQRTGTASVIGRVIASDTGGPVRFGNVSLQSADGFVWTVSTDEDGRFAIPGVPAGRYTLTVTKSGYITWVFGRDAVGAASRPEPFEVRDGQKIDRADLRLPKGGVIAGRVFDRYGDPAMGVDVRALRYTYNIPGQRQLGPAAEGLTNDLGEYRIYGLAPGRYYVGTGFTVVRQSAAQTSPALQVIPAQRGYMLTFYPGTPVASNAAPIDVTAGNEVRGIDLRLEMATLTTVSGMVLNAQGQPASGVTVMLNPARADGIMLIFPAIIHPTAGGFTFVNIPPGDYRIDVMPREGIEAVGRTGAPPPGSYEWASVPVTVGAEKIESLVVQMTPGFEVAGRIVADTGPLTPDAATTLKITVAPRLPMQGTSVGFFTGLAEVQGDGRFSVKGAAGPVGVSAFYGARAKWFVKAIRVGGLDISDEGIDVRADVPTLEVVVTTTPTRISGSVATTTGASVRDYAAAVVFSQDERKWALPRTRYVTSAKPDVEGRFTVTGLPAGNYWAAAVTTLEADWPSPDSLARLRATATSVTIADGETKTVTVVVR